MSKKSNKVGDMNADGKVWICTPYIRKNGKIIYPKKSKMFCFWAKPKKRA